MFKGNSLNRSDFLYLFIYLLIFLILFSSFFFRSNTFYERDSTLLETPLRMHTVQLLKEGNLALWTDAHGNGQPFLANPKMAIFYPTTWLYLVLPFFIAFKIHYFIHPLIGWLGMFLLAKTYGLSRRAAFLASSLFFLSGMYLSSFEFYNHIAAIAWMMWALYLQRLCWPIKSAKFLFNVLVWALLILAGAPEIIVLTILLSIVQAIIFSLSLREFGHYALRLGLILLFSVLITCIQLIPSLEMLIKSGRSSQIELWPLEPVQLINLVFPGILGDDRQPGNDNFWGGHLFNTWYPLYYSLYVGFGFLILSLFSLRNYKNRTELVLLVASASFFLISFGKYSPLYLVYKKIPFISSIRFPVKYFMGTLICLSLLAGLGLSRLEKERAGKRFGRTLLLSGVILGSAILILRQNIVTGLSNLFVIEDWRSKQSLTRSIFTGLALFLIYGLLFVLLEKTSRIKKAMLILLIIICLADPIYHNRFINPVVDQSFFDKPKIIEELAPTPTIYRDGYVPFIQGVDKIDRKTIFKYYRQSLYPFTALPYGVRYVMNDDFMATYPRVDRELNKRIRGLPLDDKLKILRYLGCQYYLGEKPLFSESESKRYAINERLGVSVQRVSEERAHPYLAYKLVSAHKNNDKLTEFLNPGFDPFEKVLVDGEVKVPEAVYMSGDENAGRPAGGELSIVEMKPGYGRFRVSSMQAAVLVVPGNYSKGWKTWVDGKRTTIFSANVFSKGVAVPPGSHEIRIKYWPDSFLMGRMISLVSMLAIIAFWIYLSTRGKHEGMPRLANQDRNELPAMGGSE